MDRSFLSVVGKSAAVLEHGGGRFAANGFLLGYGTPHAIGFLHLGDVADRNPFMLAFPVFILTLARKLRHDQGGS